MQRFTVAMADKTGGKKEQKKKPRSKTEKPKYKTVNKDSEEGGGGGQEGGGQNQNSGGQNQNIQKNNGKFQQNQNQRVQGGQQGGNQFEPYLGPAEVQRGIQNGESWGLQRRGKLVSGGLVSGLST